MTKMKPRYAESSSQTFQIDPGSHLKNYGSIRSLSNGSIQTEPCNLSDCNPHENIDVESDDQSDDASSSSQSSSLSFDQEGELQRRLNPSTQKDFDKLREELLQWRRREEVCIWIHNFL